MYVACSLVGAAGLLLCSIPADAKPSYKAYTHPSDIKSFYKWTDVIRRMDATKDAHLPAISALSYQEQLNAATIARINKAINRFKFIDDETAWGQEDYWETPHEFFLRGGGDCEDFAIAKYAILKHMGIPEKRLRIAIVKDMRLHAPHALLLVDLNGETLILDNQEKNIRGRAVNERYHPIFSINRENWWLY